MSWDSSDWSHPLATHFWLAALDLLCASKVPAEMIPGPVSLLWKKTSQEPTFPVTSADEGLKQLLALLSSWPESWKAGACPGSCLSPALFVAVLGNAFPGNFACP